jgi:hypothetical protein
MIAGTRPAARNRFTPPRRDNVRGYAFNGTDFIVLKNSGVASSIGPPRSGEKYQVPSIRQ